MSSSIIQKRRGIQVVTKADTSVIRRSTRSGSGVILSSAWCVFLLLHCCATVVFSSSENRVPDLFAFIRPKISRIVDRRSLFVMKRMYPSATTRSTGSEDMTTTRELSNHNNNEKQSIKYIEFYSGVGGWTLALQQAIQSIDKNKNNIQLECCAALDHSDLCTAVYQHNHDANMQRQTREETKTIIDAELKTKRTKKGKNENHNKAIRIETLSVQQLQDWDADIWMMSPPCQPHTRQHSNQADDLEDHRSSSFLHLCHLLQHEIPTKTLPKIILLENVIGFESSNSCQNYWLPALQTRKYRVGQFHLQPTQVGIPNDRPRYYTVAVLEQQQQQQQQSTEFRKNSDREENPLKAYLVSPTNLKMSTANKDCSTVLKSIPELQVVDEKDVSESNLPPLEEFIDNKNNCQPENNLDLSEQVFRKNAAWCMDIVNATSRRSACFTSSYGKFIKGTGSVFYKKSNLPTNNIHTKEDKVHPNEQQQYQPSFYLQAPEERQFDANWADGLSASDFRYFSGIEMARLMGFPDTFSFPPTITLKQQWKLIGNSLNVRVASKLTELALRVWWDVPP